MNETFQFFCLLHGHGKAAGGPVPKGFMIGTEVISPCDFMFNDNWGSPQAVLVPCVANPSSRSVRRGSLELCGGCSPRALITAPQTLIFLGGRPCSQPWISIPLGSGISLVAIPAVTPKTQQRIKTVKAALFLTPYQEFL